MSNKDRIESSFKELDRIDFMEKHKDFSHIDLPFSIGYGQTISQPSLVLKMTILLDPKEDEKVLEIGTGSGFQTALLSKASKSVYSVEIIKELHLSAKSRLDDLGYNNIHLKLGDGKAGWKKHAPYDKIMVTACAKEIPKELLDQLSDNGKMVIALESNYAQDLIVLSKKNNKVSNEVIGKVRFVDLV